MNEFSILHSFFLMRQSIYIFFNQQCIFATSHSYSLRSTPYQTDALKSQSMGGTGKKLQLNFRGQLKYFAGTKIDKCT